MKKSFILTLIIILALGMLLTGCANKSKNNQKIIENKETNVPLERTGDLDFLEDFEDQSPDFRNCEACDPNNLERNILIVDDVVRSGDYAMKLTIHPDDITQVAGKNKKNRLEVAYDNLDEEGSEIYYGWSFLVPKDNKFKPEGGSGFNIIGQWHDRPDKNKGETREQTAGKNPPIAVYMGTLNNQPGIRINYGLRDVNAGAVGDSPIELGKWNDIVFHIKWSQKEDGFVEVFHNGESITGKVYGPNMHNSVPHYWKTGFYRGLVGDDSTPTTNSIYIDEIRIGHSYEAVAP